MLFGLDIEPLELTWFSIQSNAKLFGLDIEAFELIPNKFSYDQISGTGKVLITIFC
jgi:hypothetical protein